MLIWSFVVGQLVYWLLAKPMMALSREMDSEVWDACLLKPRPK